MTEPVPVADVEVPGELGPEAGDAVRVNLDRLQRATEANDVAGVVGAAKDLAECACKVVIDTLGGTYGSNVKIPKLMRQTLGVLDLHPAGLQNRPALQRLSQSLAGMVQAVAELRGTDGTGHGRSRETELHSDHATLVRATVVAWCQWVLSAAGRVAKNRAEVLERVDKIDTAVFHRGEFRQFVDDLRVPELGDALQHMVGIAVARRYSVRGTFVVYKDVIQPMARGDLVFPRAFTAGVVEGLVLDYNGYLRTTPGLIDDVRSIVFRMPDADARRVIEGVAASVADAGPWYGFTAQAQEATVEAVDNWVGEETDMTIRDGVERMANRLRSL